MRVVALLLVAATLATAQAARSTGTPAPLPERLSGTGLYLPHSRSELAPGVLPYTPQYPLWSDGTSKRRWIALPAGAPIDASRPDAWQFPPGTRLWKEFAFGRRLETRYLERLPDGRWRFATYAWQPDGADARLVVDGAVLDGGPTGRYTVPSLADCLACHDAPQVPVLGFSALQLSPDRDPLAPHAESPGPDDVDLTRLVRERLLVNLPPAWLDAPPRIAAPTPVGRAALGYLHGNCGHCHVASGALDGLDLFLAQQADPAADSAARTLRSLLGHPSRYQPRGITGAPRVALEPRLPSTLLLRVRAASPLARMPPLGVQVVDVEGAALLERWIQEQQSHTQEEGP
jgi:hypothetical protein